MVEYGNSSGSRVQTTPAGTGGFLHPERIMAKLDIRPGMIVADFGAGAGYFAIPAARRVGENGKVYAIDIQKQAIDNIKSKANLEHLLNVETVWADLEVPGSTKIGSQKCDVVLLFKVLCQQQAHENTLREALRILRPGGLLMLVEWAEARFGFCPPERIVQKKQAISLIERLGAKLVEEHVIDNFHYMLEFKAGT